MHVIDIHHRHALGKQGCHVAVDKVARQLSKRFGLGPLAWTGDTIAFAGHGVEGQLTAGEDDAHVRVRLGPRLALLAPLVEIEIRRRLRHYLG